MKRHLPPNNIPAKKHTRNVKQKDEVDLTWMFGEGSSSLILQIMSKLSMLTEFIDKLGKLVNHYYCSLQSLGHNVMELFLTLVNKVKSVLVTILPFLKPYFEDKLQDEEGYSEEEEEDEDEESQSEEIKEDEEELQSDEVEVKHQHQNTKISETNKVVPITKFDKVEVKHQSRNQSRLDAISNTKIKDTPMAVPTRKVKPVVIESLDGDDNQYDGEDLIEEISNGIRQINNIQNLFSGININKVHRA